MDEELVQLINSIPTPIRIIDIDSLNRPVFGAFNTAALQDVDISLEDIVGRTADEIYPGVVGEMATNCHMAVIRSGRPLMFEIEEDLPDGKHWYRTTLAPVTNEAGKVQRIFCTQVDITEVKRIQSVESDADRRIREAEQYIALAAHDLRTPMRNVQMIADFLKDDFEDMGDGKMQMILALEETATQAMSLISDVLAHAQTTTKRIPKVEKFQLEEMCDKIVSVLDPLGQHTVMCNHYSVIADKITVQIAIGNLIDNALKHNDTNGLLLTVSVHQKNTEFIEVRVTDNGKGFGDSAVSFIDSGEIMAGCGFGLVGVRRLVRERGGDLCVDSAGDESGAVVSFTLPGTVLESFQDVA